MNFLGRVELMRHQYSKAVSWLEQAVAVAARTGQTFVEGYARKDLALALTRLGKLGIAQAEIQRAEEIFGVMKFDEGLAHVERVKGIWLRLSDRWNESRGHLQSARLHFHDSGELAEEALTRLEIARTMEKLGEVPFVILQEYREALRLAELSQRAGIVHEIENSLREHDSYEYQTIMFRRVRGRETPSATYSLTDAERSSSTVLYLDLIGSTAYADEVDPMIMLLALNQMMKEFLAILHRFEGLVSGFRGDGFLAIFREQDHALRAVRCGLKLATTVTKINGPRMLLELPEFEIRIGIESGQMTLGNMGSYEKMDYTAIGTPANRGARIQSSANAGIPRVGPGAHDLVRAHFDFTDESPIAVDMKGLGIVNTWDVIREKP